MHKSNTVDSVDDSTQVQTQNSVKESIHDSSDVRRANELISLHYNVKVKYLKSGLDSELVQARRDVDRVVAILQKGQ